MDEGDTTVNAIIGGVVTTVLTGVPILGPIVGGAVTGYLQGGTRSDGVKVGASAGLVALVPAVLWILLVATAFGVVGVAGGNAVFLGVGLLGVFLLLFTLFLLGVYLVGLSALGGWLGNYVKYDTEYGDSPSVDAENAGSR